MKPDAAFVRKLKKYDKGLRVRWDNRIDRFCVQHKNDGRWDHVFIVMENDKSFRALDDRTIDRIKEMDTWRSFGKGWSKLKRESVEAKLDAPYSDWESKADERYHDWFQNEYADRLLHAIKNDRRLRDEASGADVDTALAVAESKAEAYDALENADSGVVSIDHETGIYKVTG